MQILRAGIAGVDTASVSRCMPTVDGAVELDPGIRTLPGRFSNLTQQAAGLHRASHRTIAASSESPVGVVEHGLHELIGYTHGVVGVLVLDRVNIHSVQAHVETSCLQRMCLSFFTRLAPDELFDIGVIGIKNHHLGGTAGLASRFDRARGGIGAAHKAHRATSSATTSKTFH